MNGRTTEATATIPAGEVSGRPFPNEHACRIEDPGKYKSFARESNEGKTPDRIFGILGPKRSEIQAYRYPTTRFTEAEARAHCRKAGGSFEAATGEKTGDTTMRLPKMYRTFEAEFTRAGDDGNGRPLYEMSFSSEFPAPRWWGTEILGHSAGEYDFSRLNAGAGVYVDAHAAAGGRRVGRVMKAWVDEKKKKGRALVRFSRTPIGEQTRTEVDDGDLVGTSVGYIVRRMTLVEDDAKKGKEYRASRWEAWEITLAGIAVDPTVGIGRAGWDERTFEVEVEGGTPSTEETHMRGSLGGPERGRMEEHAEAGGGAATEAAAAAAAAAAVPTLAGRGGGDPQAPARPKDDWNPDAIGKLAEAHGQLAKLPGWLGRRATEREVSDEILASYKGRPTGQPAAESIVDMTKRDRGRYSYRRALELALRKREGGKLDGLELELEVSNDIEKRLPPFVERHDGVHMPTVLDPEALERQRAMRLEAQLAGRAMGAFVGGGGAELVHAQPRELLEILRDKLILAQLGATFLDGLTAPMQWPKQTTDPTSFWMDENPSADAAETEANLVTVNLSPKTLIARVPLPKQLITLATVQVEAWIRRALGAVDAQAIHRAAFHGTGTDKQPMGIYTSPGIQAFAMGGVPTFEKLVDMTAKLPDKNADDGSIGWAFTPLMAGLLRRVPVLPGTASGFIWTGRYTGGDVAGYPAYSSNRIRKDLGAGTNEHGIVHGNWNNCVIGQWGAFEVLADPFTLAGKGQVRLTTFNMADVVFLRGESFVIATGATLL